jgi:IAA-amino acid hydrolase
MPTSGSSLLGRARAREAELVELRRDLHRHPELAFQETRTAARAAEAARSAGFVVRTGVARTGVVAELDNGPGPAVALRADMDALPIQEETGLPFASSVAGVMHACGHDAHTAALIGAAGLLGELHREGRLPPGRVRLLFQPSEEGMDAQGKSGGRRMVEEGAMEGIGAVVGLHVGAHLPAGRVFLGEGPFFGGTDEVYVTVHGRSSHAARPQEGVDAVALAALGVVAAQQVVARRIPPAAEGVLTFGTIEGGRAANVLADRVRLCGTLRYFDPEVRRKLHEGIRWAFGVSEGTGGRSEVRIVPGYPPVVNDPEVTAWVREAAGEVVGEDAIEEGERTLLAEDFAFLAEAAPGAFLWLGASPGEPREHHHPNFDIDEAVLPLAAAILARAAVVVLERLEPRKDVPGAPAHENDEER